MTDTMSNRRTRAKSAKLGMTVTPPKVDPYAKLSERIETGKRAQEDLETAGRRHISPKAATRGQKRLPKVKVPLTDRKPKGRA